MEPTISVVIPWRAREDRQYAFDRVVEWYQVNLPQANIITVDDGRVPFCLSGSRNLGVKMAEEAGADAVILNDADTIPQLSSIMFATEWAVLGDRVVLPYTQYRSLQEKGTNQFRDGKDLAVCHAFVVDGACSGVYVFSPKVWWSHFGQDERFRGWGFEDAAWYAAHTTLIGRPPKRIDGSVYAFTHESEIKEGPDYERNAALCYRYLDMESRGDKEGMAELASQGLFVDF